MISAFLNTGFGASSTRQQRLQQDGEPGPDRRPTDRANRREARQSGNVLVAWVDRQKCDPGNRFRATDAAGGRGYDAGRARQPRTAIDSGQKKAVEGMIASCGLSFTVTRIADVAARFDLPLINYVHGAITKADNGKLPPSNDPSKLL